MKNLLTYVLFLLISVSCTNDFICCDNPPGHFYNVSVIDSQERDLMDPSTPHYFNPENIRLYRLEGGEEILVTKTGGVELNSRYGVHPFMFDGKNCVRLFFGYEGTADQFTGVIQWNEDERDVLVHKFNMPGERKALVQVLRNGEVLWDAGNESSPPFFTIQR